MKSKNRTLNREHEEVQRSESFSLRGFQKARGATLNSPPSGCLQKTLFVWFPNSFMLKWINLSSSWGEDFLSQPSNTKIAQFQSNFSEKIFSESLRDFFNIKVKFETMFYLKSFEGSFANTVHNFLQENRLQIMRKSFTDNSPNRAFTIVKTAVEIFLETDSLKLSSAIITSRLHILETEPNHLQNNYQESLRVCGDFRSFSNHDVISIQPPQKLVLLILKLRA